MEDPSSPGRIDPAPPSPNRRRFLRWVSMIGAGTSAVLVAYPAFEAFLWPIRPTPPRENWVKVAEDIALVDIGVPVRVDFVQLENDAWFQDRVLNSVWLYTEDGEDFKAYNGHCTHLGCGYTYDKQKQVFACPCHRGVFDAKTGAVLSGPPPRPLDELPVEVRDGMVYVNYQEFRLGVEQKVKV